ncbi:hypothetical protein QAD02_010634 [Eretmocerus hayati]|uniref:Uncharacterized protein n=1 Tax=Eretmocerus hayati TaxID=131215 RepID=A0ACC2NVE3_9HYME|nr:hypothetical protein QAD02_010634 [Eretmocerus hayati]
MAIGKKIYVVKSFNAPMKVEASCTLYFELSDRAIKRLQQSNSSLHELSLKNEYEILFESGKHSDVTVTVDNHKLHLHINILSSRSTVFACMFDSELGENTPRFLFIDDASFEVMREFFRYIYAAKVKNLESIAVELLIVADKYAVEGLKTICEQNLIRNLKSENAVEYLNLAYLHYKLGSSVKGIFFFYYITWLKWTKIQGFDLQMGFHG